MARSPNISSAYVFALTCAIIAGSGIGRGAAAQTQLPEIVVTTPSPVRRPSPPKPAAPATTAPTPAPAASEPTPLPGTSLQIPTAPSFVAEAVMTRPELAAQPFAQLGDALGTKPGLASTTFAPGASRPVIRGLSGFRVRIQENGLATGDVSALSDDHAVPIDPLGAGQVEVVRGPRRCAMARRRSAASSTPSTTASPPRSHQRLSWSRREAVSAAWTTGATGGALVEAGAGNFVVHADTFSGSAGGLPHPRGCAGQHQFRQRGLLARRLVRLQRRLPWARVHIVQQHLLHPWHRGGRGTKTTSSSISQIDEQGRVAHQRHRTGGHPLLVWRHRLQARRGGYWAPSP